MALVPVTYDREADALYVRLLDKSVSKTKAVDDLRLIDYAHGVAIIGVEFLQASGGIDLSGLPLRSELARLIGESGLHFPVFVGP
jgi:uncharacterized protein YuzE